MEHSFLLSMGYWNLIGSIALYLMLNKAIADNILRKWTEVISQPYDVGQYGTLWLLWAATTNAFLSIINIFAANWEPVSQTTVVSSDLLVYVIFLIATIAVHKNKSYHRGLYFTILLELFWILWAVYLLFV